MDDGVYPSSNLHLNIYSLGIALLLSVRWHFLPRSPRRRASRVATGFVEYLFSQTPQGPICRKWAHVVNTTRQYCSCPNLWPSKMKYKNIPWQMVVETAFLFAHLECAGRCCSVTIVTLFFAAETLGRCLGIQDIIDHKLIS